MGMSFNAVIRHSFSFPSNLLSLFPSFLRLLSDLAVAVRAAITSFPEMHLGNLAVNFCSSLLMCFVFFLICVFCITGTAFIPLNSSQCYLMKFHHILRKKHLSTESVLPNTNPE